MVLFYLLWKNDILLESKRIEKSELGYTFYRLRLKLRFLREIEDAKNSGHILQFNRKYEKNCRGDAQRSGGR
jgi:hypothetical protein